jgi:chitinase
LHSVAARRWFSVLAAATALAVCAAGCAGTGTPPPVGSSAAATTATGVAPYVDVTLAATPLTEMTTATGVADVVFAFALATDGRCEPSWGGIRAVDDPAIAGRISAFRDQGGRVTVATGGATGDYLENACTSAADLARAYGTLIDTTGARRLDVDIEADVPTDTVVEALTTVQQTHDVDISLTLRVADAGRGLEAGALDQVRAADAAGLRFTVNAMIMNFPDDGDWRRAMLGALGSFADQLAGVWPGTGVGDRLGITLMLGRNDTGPVTTLDDAHAVATEAAARGITDLRLWSLSRDNGNCDGAPAARPDCSGIAQSQFAFITTFRDAVRAPGTTTTSTNGRNGS